MSPHPESRDPDRALDGVAPRRSAPSEAPSLPASGPADELEALRALPRLAASPGFTQRLLLRLDDEERRRADRRSPPLLRWAWAGAAILLLAAVGVSGWRERDQQRRAFRGQLESLQAERRALSSELRRLQSRDVLYLGSDDRFDYLLDPSGYGPATTPARGEIVPASAVY